MACAGNHHEELVVVVAWNHSELFVGVASEIERVGLLALENHNSALDFGGPAITIRTGRCSLAAIAKAV